MANQSVGSRLRTTRRERDLTLAEVANRTGISVSTLSRIESGERQPALDHLLPLADVYRLSLDELVGHQRTADPRVRAETVTRDGLSFVPLTHGVDGLRAYKITYPPGAGGPTPDPRSHEGHDWLYVLSGRLRLVLGEHDLVLRAGEAAEFDTHTPHWMSNPTTRPTEVLTLFGPQGERMHMRARPKRG